MHLSPEEDTSVHKKRRMRTPGEVRGRGMEGRKIGRDSRKNCSFASLPIEVFVFPPVFVYIYISLTDLGFHQFF